MSNSLEKLFVEEVVLRESESGDFPAVIISGISINISETGSQSFAKRRVSMPANGFTLAEAKQLFPIGMKLEGFRIEQYEVDPYEWTTPDGEIRSDNVRYRLRKVDKKATLEDEVFESHRSNANLQLQD